jgi:hypothetical protein
VQAAEHTDAVNELSRAQLEDRKTAWPLAALAGKVRILEKLVECANEKLTAGDVNNKLLDKNHKEQTAGHVVADESKTDMLQKMWEWAEKI